ncbi:MAG: hypothetical protein ABFD94_17190, partial [Armatimonadia bacterium]
MQKGLLKFSAPILLALFLYLAFTSAVSAARTERAAGPLIPVNGLSLFTKNPSARPIIGQNLPTPPALMQTRQTGPDLDMNLTPTAVATYEKQPNASPGATQNRIVFVSNGVDAVNNTTGNDAADRQIDATAPANANDDLWIMRSDGSEQYKLLSMAGDQVDPSYDPGGRLVAFSSQVNGIWQIFTVEVRDPSIVRQITFGAGDKLHATWSPDSNWIAFQCNLNGTWDIYKVASSGAQLIQPITSGVADDTDPTWSPSGGVLAFTRDAGGVQRIFICAPDGTELEQISNGGGDATADDKEPAFRPDPTDPQDAKYGYAIAFASTRA